MSIDLTIPIYLISLKTDEDRRRELEKRFNNFYSCFKYIEAVDGRKLDAKEYYNKIIPYYLELKNIMSPAELGCTLSHIKALNDFLQTNEPYALILEDDVIGSDQDLKSIFDITANLDSNSLLICGAQNGLSRRHQLGKWIDNKGVYEVANFSYSFVLRTCCYVVTRKTAQQIIDFHSINLTLADKWDCFFNNTSTKIYYINALHHPEDLADSHIEADRATFKNKTFIQKICSSDAPIKIFRKTKDEVHRLVLLMLGSKQLP